jgi:endonuclease/exonuclease/phosphatase family metal-dependent hydrolase
LWVGEKPQQGVGVIAGDGYRIERLTSRPDAPASSIPVAVTGRNSFFLLAVWSRVDADRSYAHSMLRSVEAYRALILAQPTVIAGDFNTNAIWDRGRGSGSDHSALVQKLEDLDLVSAYHAFHGEAHGAETRPNLYFLWRENAPYHIDYCFIPRGWAPLLRGVEVGTFTDWKDPSDHRPLVVDLAL